MIDLPFSDGTFAASSVEPDGFSQRDIEIMEGPGGRAYGGILSNGRHSQTEEAEGAGHSYGALECFNGARRRHQPQS